MPQGDNQDELHKAPQKVGPGKNKHVTFSCGQIYTTFWIGFPSFPIQILHSLTIALLDHFPNKLAAQKSLLPGKPWDKLECEYD